jgi:hypothetical protein
MFSRTMWSCAAVVVAGACWFGVGVRADDTAAANGAAKQEQSSGGMDPAMMEAWQKYMAPGEHHKSLEAMAGNFKAVTKWKMDPSMDWQTSEGTYAGEMAMGGRFLLSRHGGNMMGMPFEGMGWMGYDNSLQKHVSAWIDNMGTGVMRSEGTCDPAGKVITFDGDMKDPMTGKMTRYRYIYTIKSNDEFDFRWYMPDPATGDLWESMIITYTRVP